MKKHQSFRKKLPIELLFILSVPLSIFFLNDLRTPTNILFALILTALPYILIVINSFYILLKMLRVFRTHNRHQINTLMLINICITITSLLFFTDLSIGKEIIFYNLNRDGFARLSNIGQHSDCYLSNSSCLEYIELSNGIEHSPHRERIFALSSTLGTRIIGTISRYNVYYVYYGNQDSIPFRQQIYQSYVDCIHALGDGWFICTLW